MEIWPFTGYYDYMEISTMTFRDGAILIHAIAAAIGLGTVFTTDYLIMKFLRDGRISEERARTLHHLSEVIWIAIVLLVSSGIYLAVTKAGILHSSKFLLKLAVVGIVIVNGVVLNLFLTPRLHKIAFKEGAGLANDEPDRIRKIALFAGATSAFSWVLAFILGKFKAIPLSFAEALGYYLGILVVIAIVASLSKKKRA